MCDRSYSRVFTGLGVLFSFYSSYIRVEHERVIVFFFFEQLSRAHSYAILKCCMFIPIKNIGNMLENYGPSV